MEKPTEDTYVAEFVSVAKQLGAFLGFDAEFNRKTPSGKPDIIIYYKIFCQLMNLYLSLKSRVDLKQIECLRSI